MPKPSKYIENKSHVLFDMYRQLADIKQSKAFKEGDTSSADSVQKSIDAFVKRHNSSKKSPLRVPQLQLPMSVA
eukprot:CAMPEP_0119058378 /NCGR_PEP_ID=MMETSP1178-20130426/2731_1 /TAXON_ID=33656 /ORGANISM="unid sp, Strain CCMP2000" /LENGTH=73 /DNA_ID=CAMNT_0007039311 /DNA_START=139 /DNA_END=360 /DNA_ORIENTATION=-